jgi:hypothetical protein
MGFPSANRSGAAFAHGSVARTHSLFPPPIHCSTLSTTKVAGRHSHAPTGYVLGRARPVLHKGATSLCLGRVHAPTAPEVVFNSMTSGSSALEKASNCRNFAVNVPSCGHKRGVRTTGQAQGWEPTAAACGGTKWAGPAVHTTPLPLGTHNTARKLQQ